MSTSLKEASSSIAAAKEQVGTREQDASEIVASNVFKSYGAGPFAKEVVKDCSFTIESNKLTVMIGPSAVSYTHLTLPTKA